jgi:hypothetical protein
MNKHLLKPQLTPYGADYAQWCAEQGALLRAGRVDAVDRENLAEEIESLGRSDKREIRSRLKELLLHLLKWHFQARKRRGGWRASIVEQRMIEATARGKPQLARLAVAGACKVVSCRPGKGS